MEDSSINRADTQIILDAFNTLRAAVFMLKIARDATISLTNLQKDKIYGLEQVVANRSGALTEMIGMPDRLKANPNLDNEVLQQLSEVISMFGNPDTRPAAIELMEPGGRWALFERARNNARSMTDDEYKKWYRRTFYNEQH